VTSCSSSALTAGVLGEVEVAEHLVPDPDGDTEEAAHRRVVRREPGAAGVVAQVRQAQWLRVVDQQTEEPLTVRQPADLLDGRLTHPGVHELGQRPVVTDDAQRGVPGVHELPGRPDDVAEHHRQAQVAGHHGVGPEQGP
jgi:hypothetical protein